jgi:hypothetical protein
MTGRVLTVAALVSALSTLTLQSQQTIGELDLLLERLGQYLIAYESQLTTVVGDERYEQSQLQPMGRSRSMFNQSRRLDSEIAFLRLPGEAIWYGVRDVKRVDGVQVDEGVKTPQLDELLKRLDAASMQEAATIVAKSAQYNLGGARTMNMPTTPLAVLHPENHVRFVFKVKGTTTIERRRTKRLDFEEFDEPTLVSGSEGTPFFLNGSAWIEPDSGRLWRVELTLKPKTDDVQMARAVQNRLRVDYTELPALNMMVPKEMWEVFWVSGGRGEGHARYSNYRQFATAAKIIPQVLDDRSRR